MVFDSFRPGLRELLGTTGLGGRKAEATPKASTYLSSEIDVRCVRDVRCIMSEPICKAEGSMIWGQPTSHSLGPSPMRGFITLFLMWSANNPD